MRIGLLLGLLLGADPAPRDLYQNPVPEDVPALVAALKDQNLQHGSAVALAKVGKPAVPALLGALDAKNATLRLWAVFALGGIGPDARPAVPALTKAAKEEDEVLRAVAVEALGKIGPDARSAVPILVEALKDKETRVRCLAAVALGRIRPDGKEEVQALIAAFKDEPVRKAAGEALVQIGKPALPGLQEALADPDLRLDAAYALRRIDVPTAAKAGVDRTTAADIPALVRALTNANRSTDGRRRAADALGQLGKEAIPAIPALAEVLGDEAVRASAVPALGKIGKPAVPALVGQLKAPSAAARESAALALGKVGPDAKNTIPALVEALQDRERDVRRAAGVALEEIGPDADKAVPALVKVLKRNDAEPVQQAAIKALVRADPEAKPAVVAALLDAIKEGNYGVKTLAEWALKKIDPAAAEKAGIR